MGNKDVVYSTRGGSTPSRPSTLTTVSDGRTVVGRRIVYLRADGEHEDELVQLFGGLGGRARTVYGQDHLKSEQRNQHERRTDSAPASRNSSPFVHCHKLIL